MVNEKRLSETFRFLAGINSVSTKEGAIAEELRKILASLGGRVIVDDSSGKTGSETGNLVAKFAENANKEALLLNAHMDTVGPGENVKINFSDGIFTSCGQTVLGADDKSGLAVIIETLRIIFENRLPTPPLEVVFTVCEEIGLRGAKHLDYSLLTAKEGYILDTTDTECIVVRAPAANSLKFKIHGKAAHAGIDPENGTNAIALAGIAVSGFAAGRIDHETTRNIGAIRGGTAINIVPELAIVECEARSHDIEKLDSITDEMVSAFERAVNDFPGKKSVDFPPFLETFVERAFPRTNIGEDHHVITAAGRAASKLGRNLKPIKTGGGSDANIFFGKGIFAATLGIGMKDIHTTRESIKLGDMVKTAELMLEIVRDRKE